MKIKDQLHGILNDLSAASTESTLLAGTFLLLIVGLMTKRVMVIKAVFALVLLLGIVVNLQISEEGYYLSSSLFLNQEILSFTSLLLIFGLMILIFPRKRHTPEFYFFTISILVGSTFLMKANSLLMVYLSVELISFVSYILTGFTFTKEGFEAGIKYLLFGAVSSAVMLVGLGLTYGTTGTFFISEWSALLINQPLAELGFVFVMMGLFFKVSIFPFHGWTPATYQAAPVDSVALFSIVPKLAGLVLLRRIYNSLNFAFDHWLIYGVLILGLLTILVGTLGALKQANTRRMVSFGSIAHSGFLLGFVLIPSGMSNEGAFWWYAVVYGLMNFGAFFLIAYFEASSIIRNDEYVRAKNERWVVVMFTLILVSLVGLPPLAGFTAKLFLFTSLWSIYLETGSVFEVLFLAGAILATVASLFFYLRVPKTVFLNGIDQEPDNLAHPFSWKIKIIATIFGITMLMLFFAPELVMSLKSLLTNAHE